MFDYLLKKVRSATVRPAPFPHLRIDDFFSLGDFNEFLNSREVTFEVQRSNADLERQANQVGYVPIKFPGAFTDWAQYREDQDLRKSATGSDPGKHTASETRGLVLRLLEPTSRYMRDLTSFLDSGQLQREICNKLGIDFGESFVDGGVQKYLNGYEIPPHPDVRQKLLTLLVPLHPSAYEPSGAHVSVGTHLLKFRPEFQSVSHFWATHDHHDRCWVPWSWCETVDVHYQSNSLLAFSPSNESLHGVKAQYDHLRWQRTHLYSNVWHPKRSCERQPQYEEILSYITNQ